MNKKYENLEKKLSIATKLVDELIISEEEYPIAIVDTEIEETKVFTLDALRTDFLLVRNILIKSISTGQRVLDTASLIDVSDMKAPQLQAISGMISTIGNNSKLLISIYKDVSEIEKLRQKDSNIQTPVGGVNMGTVNNNNILFSGSSSELLDIFKANQQL